MTIRSSIGKTSSPARLATTPIFFFPSYVKMWNLSMHLICAIAFCFLIALDRPAFGQPDPPESITIENNFDRGNKKYSDSCVSDRECGFNGSYCEPKKNICTCREEFKITNHIDKCGNPVNVNESCFFHEQCEARVSQTECRDNRCICIFEKIPVTQPDGAIVCIAENKEPPSLQYVDPAMIGVLVGMALMFVIICVVLRLFSKARWRENRTIFNTPNARLMNVSLLRDNKLLHTQERRGSRASVRVPSRQPSMVSLRAHSPNASQGAKHTQHSQHRVSRSRTGSRRGSRGSSGNASAVSTKSNNKSPPSNPQNNVTDPVLENVTVEILEPKA
ncbi:PREDICTED: uncharacterized protein LOC107072923 isoform X1 [Polistes dominula]|uniref:Uncharacterized protein LOC107072923 isoform X1 n=1 Tax=Polistes dominula TaxID=743375 RepID=A0ABM1J8E4_POLDO|nr:PREDICTED: uncharacterized protein LOC107072923 isoform X1 [Polistes dominula]